MNYDPRALHKIATALHTHGAGGSWNCYDELIKLIAKIDKTGDITNRDLDKLRRVLESIGLIQDVLDECVRGRNLRANKAQETQELQN